MEGDWSGAVVVGNERELELAHKVATRFFFRAEEDVAATEKAREEDPEALPRFKDVEFVEMHIPGDKLNIVVKPVDATIRKLYAKRYADWKAGRQDVLTGIPLQELPGVFESQIQTLQFAKVRTVEELADLSDEVLQRLGIGYRALSVRAKAYLDKARGGAQEAKLQKAIAEKDAQVAALTKRLEALEAKGGNQKKAG